MRKKRKEKMNQKTRPVFIFKEFCLGYRAVFKQAGFFGHQKIFNTILDGLPSHTMLWFLAAIAHSFQH
jgi:hypothetical protein